MTTAHIIWSVKTRDKRGSGMRPKLLAAAVATCFAFGPQAALANPTGPTVVSGNASFAASGNALTITNSANAIINWRGFSIGVNEITRFLQPSAASAVLNRVVGSGGVIPQSVIDGVLTSNGRVFLLNPSGIVIGAGARIDVAGLVASSLNLSNEDFLAGRLRFAEVPGAGGVANHGVIETSSGGRVFLVAPDVQNSGIIRAPQGEIVLAAGKSAELVSESSPYVTVNVVADAERALNVGQLVAESGRIGMYGALVRNSGVAEASGAVADAGGQIRFVATKDLTLDAGSHVAANGTTGGSIVLQAQGGTNTIAGTVEATGSAGSGGTVQALGLRVGVVGNGVIDASGETGGGMVLVGGDYQGRNAAVQNSQSTWIEKDGVIRADARTTGDGGRVIVWSDGDTAFRGSISARGGSQSGDGGFAETSGKGTLTVAGGRIDLRAPNGAGGAWLLDPVIYNIDAAEAGTIASNFASSGSVSVYADQDVNFLANLDLPAYGGGGFFNATAYAGDINFNTFNLTTQGASVYMTAGNRVTSSPGGGNISTNGAPIYLSGNNGIAVGNLNSAGGAGSGSWVSMYSPYGAVSAGDIMTGGSYANYVNIYAPAGDVTTKNVTTGSSAFGESYIFVYAGGSVRTGNLATGNSFGGEIGGDSSVDLTAVNGGVYTGSVTTGAAGWGSYVLATANSVATIQMGNIATGTSPNSYVDLYDATGAIVTGNITTGGSTNPAAASNAQVFIDAGAGVTTGTISAATANEGDGVGIITSAGDINTGSIITRGANPGADAGDVVLSAPAGSVKVNGIIDARGTDNPGGIGGNGGSVIIQALDTVVVGPPPTFGVNNTVINTSGGSGSLEGGHAGSVFVDPTAITINGVILALGGAGGSGPGGDGGNLDLITSNGTVTFVNGGWDLTGGAGNGPGLNGSVNIVGTLIFAFVNSPLANTTVSQAIGQTILAAEKATEPVVVEEDESETNKKKKPLASCRPG